MTPDRRTKMTTRRTVRRPGLAPRDRRGSVLVVVLALLGALMLLGFLFYTIASQERENARYFTASQKWYAAQLDADELMNFALEQIIVGPQDDLANSALWGGRFSLLASLVGDDFQPYSGRGLNLMQGASPGLPVVDQDQDGNADTGIDQTGDGVADVGNDTIGATASPDGIDDRLTLNLAGVATLNPSGLNFRTAFGFGAAPDVPYTYPDINSPFLAFVTTEPISGRKVVIPSFHRPQYLRGLFTAAPAGPANDLVPPSNWYTDQRTLPYVLGAHAARTAKTFNYGTGQIQDTGVLRFQGGAAGPFFSETYQYKNSLGATVTANRLDPGEGHWDMDGSSQPEYGYLADPDADGVNDAVWTDLDYPVEETPDGTSTFIPLFAVSIYDLDALLNLNAHGNMYGDVPADLASVPANPFQFLSTSNEGRRRSDINVEYGLMNGPAAMPTGADYTQHQRFFGVAPTTPTQLANMEWWFIAAGRGDLDGPLGTGKATQLYPGRWGEAQRLAAVLDPSSATRNPYAYPLPGLSQSDEAAGVADGNRGSAFIDVVGQLFPPSMIFPAPRQPEDNQGQGTFVAPDGKTPLAQMATNPAFEALLPAAFQAADAAMGRLRVPLYHQYWLPSSTTKIGPEWTYALGANFPTTQTLVTAATTGLSTFASVYSGVDVGRLIDNPDETMLDPELARDQITDSIFGPDETASLFMANNDRTNNGVVSRLINLVPANFATAQDAGDRRRRFTTISADLKSYAPSIPVNPTRASNEIDAPYAAFPAASTFPRWLPTPLSGRTPGPANATWEVLPNGQAMPAGYPDRAGTSSYDEPVRAEARAFIGSQPNIAAFPTVRPNVKELIRKLSVNQVASATVGRDNVPRYLLRPLTPHPGLHPENGLPSLGANNVTAPANVPLAAGQPIFGIADTDLYTLEASDGDYVDGYLPATIQPVDDDSDSSTAMVPNPALQEWHARRDRQNLARDIYTLLYLTGNPNPSVNAYTSNDPPGAVYTDAQMVEMAQFAVNLVDAMDPDDTITCFVFDMNFSDGYTPRDDGYSDPVTTLRDRGIDEDNSGSTSNDARYYLDPPSTVNRRGMVYGVEAQKLAFGEALAILAKQYKKSGNPTDFKATDWDDKEHRDFTYVELQNMTPTAVRLAGGWSIVAQPSLAGGTVNTPDARAVTLNASLADPAAYISAAGLITVGTVGDASNTDRTNPSDARTPWDVNNPTKVRPSNFNVDITGSESSDPPDFQPGNGTDTRYERVAPVPVSLDFDLMARENSAGTQQSFRITHVNTGDPSADTDAYGGFDIDENPSNAPTVPKAGGWLNLGPRANRDDLTGGNVTFYLRRRLNVSRTTPAQFYPAATYTGGTVAVQAPIERDNPWVIVDQITVPLRVFNLNGGAVVSAQVDQMIALQRREPLANTTIPSPSGSATAADSTIPTWRNNNLGLPAQISNGAGAATVAYPAMRLWQRHFDRQYASLADVLMVPLYGPRGLTDGYFGAAGSDPALTPAVVADPLQTAAVNFLFPEADYRPVFSALPANTRAPGARVQVQSAGNLWYRLFEFLDVPQKYGDNDGLPWFAQYGGPSPWLSDPNRQQPSLRERLRHREFGKLNLNTMRDPQALAALLDAGSPNKQVYTFQNQLPPMSGNVGYLPSANGETWGANARDWWLTMVASRDGGLDAYSQANFGGMNVILPGLPSAKPFLDFGSAPPGNTGTQILADFERTLLRTMPNTAGTWNGYETTTVTRRGLFELGQEGATVPAAPMPTYASPLGSNADFSSRYRLLGKVLNNATTRSNTYVAFIQVDFFDATLDPTNTAYQIGAKRADSPGYRGVFVIDRSLALEMLRRRDLPPVDQNLQYPQNSVYRTYSFAREPGPDQRPKPTFDWKKLILSRRIIAQ